MENWLQNWKFCIFDLNFTQIWLFLHGYDLLRPTYAFKSICLVLQCLRNHFFCPFMDLHCFKWKIGIKICDFVFLTKILPKFFLNFALFAYLRSPTAHLCLSKYIFGIVLFAQLLFQSIYGFTEFQIENWLQNWRFCVFDPILPQFWP